jgi:hypothetical protein
MPGGYKGRATFKTDTGWDGTATEPGWADTFLPAVGWVKSGQVFTPRSEAPGSNVKTLTIGAYVDGVFKSIRGAAGTGRWVSPTGKPSYIEWDFMGVWVAPSDVALITPTYPTTLPLRYATATTTWNSVALCLENITFDFGNEIILRECAATVAGYESALIVNRQPRITGNPEAKLIATQDRYGQLIASTEGILTWNLDGPTNSTITFSAPKAQIIGITEGDRSGLVIDEIEWAANKNGTTADQEVSITFTAAS